MKYRLVAALVICISLPVSAADWPQWRGPNRDGKSSETGFGAWPKSGPKLLWTFEEAGLGYSGPAIVGDVLYGLGSEGDTEEFAFAVDVKTGKQLWRSKISPGFKNAWGNGPRGTPTVEGGCVYAISGSGHVSCLDATSGSSRWSKDFHKDLNGKMMPPMNWGFSESILVDGVQVICSPGGEDGTLACLDKKTGDIRWRSKELTDDASYSSVVITEAVGIRQYVQLTGKGVAGVSAKDGKLLWYVEGEGFATAVIPTAIISGDYVYATTDYGAKCMLIKLSKSGDGVKAEKVYSNKNLENHHGGAILHDGHVFASHGNANSGKTLTFACQDLMSGEVAWKEGKALEGSSITFADGDFYCYGQRTGTLVRIAGTYKEFVERGRFTIPKESKQRSARGAIWTHPVIANGKLYLRDQELLYCYALK
jgi:outer membrane protein assembly factor BamB